jgi:hypothetical protein
MKLEGNWLGFKKLKRGTETSENDRIPPRRIRK